MTENTVNVDIYKVVYGNLVVMRVDSPATAKQLRAIVNSPALRAYYSADNSIVTKDNINEHLCGGGGGGTAASVSYDNTESELEADNVQTAIDEVAGRGGHAPLVIEYTLDGESEMTLDYILDGVTEMKTAMDSGREVKFIMTFDIGGLGLSIPVEYKLATIMDITAMGQRIIEAHFGAVSSESLLEDLMGGASSGLAVSAMIIDDSGSGSTITMTKMSFDKPGGGASASETTYDPPSGHSEYGYNVQSALDKAISNLNNRVTTITKYSTDDQTPSAKAVYNLLGTIESALEEI